MAEEGMWFLVVQKWYHPVWCISMLWSFYLICFLMKHIITIYNIYLSSIYIYIYIRIPLMLSLKRATESWCGFWRWKAWSTKMRPEIESHHLDAVDGNQKSGKLTSWGTGSWNPVICRVFGIHPNGGCLGFLNHQQCLINPSQVERDFFHDDATADIWACNERLFSSKASDS